MTPNWPDMIHQRMPAAVAAFQPNGGTSTSTQHQSDLCWVDEFLDFSSARRETHRRSISDSIAFLEAPMLEECRGGSNAPPGTGTSSNHEFDKFDDEQFMSMFPDDMPNAVVPTVSSSKPSTPSDHNSINEDQKQQIDTIRKESEEVQSQHKTESQEAAATTDASTDQIIDPKRVKRILANRQSAQRSRVRKLHYISELERISVLSPRVAFLDHHRLLLNVDNSALKQRIAALAQDKIFKDAHQEALKREIERLRQVYHQQNLKKMENDATHSPTPTSPAIADVKASTE
ncbi:basic leucine zipper 61-like isoform X2 [Durio zibethinus]|uniref:Basic leucine zipper 61-like isoform X2 n=1 Tax=Durio zibethinus TaxID=66656 RepID=A0A6P5YKI9_DURZI|nr:basic leucine zipper 61-like isoform X2 [Durio zibethinus]